MTNDDEELTNRTDIPTLPEADDSPKPPPIEHLPVAGAEGLPDDVKNGEINADADDGSDIHEEEPA
jgi:hypothetical protein